MNARLIVSIALIALLLLFSAQNYQVVRVRFLFWHLDMSRAVLILLVLAAGIIIGWILSSWRRRSRPST